MGSERSRIPVQSGAAPAVSRPVSPYLAFEQTHFRQTLTSSDRHQETRDAYVAGWVHAPGTLGVFVASAAGVAGVVSGAEIFRGANIGYPPISRLVTWMHQLLLLLAGPLKAEG